MSTHAALLRRLTTMARKRDAAESKLAAVYAEGADLYMEGRAMDPPVPIPEMAAAAGVSTDAVNKSLRKARTEGERRHLNGRGVPRS